jgi:hypothetical protein
VLGIPPIDPGDHHINININHRTCDLLHIGHLDLLERLRAPDDIRWQILDTGRKSVTTSTMPTPRASITFMAILGNSRGIISSAAVECPKCEQS